MGIAWVLLPPGTGCNTFSVVTIIKIIECHISSRGKGHNSIKDIELFKNRQSKTNAYRRSRLCSILLWLLILYDGPIKNVVKIISCHLLQRKNPTIIVQYLETALEIINFGDRCNNEEWIMETKINIWITAYLYNIQVLISSLDHLEILESHTNWWSRRMAINSPGSDRPLCLLYVYFLDSLYCTAY